MSTGYYSTGGGSTTRNGQAGMGCGCSAVFCVQCRFVDNDKSVCVSLVSCYTSMKISFHHAAWLLSRGVNGIWFPSPAVCGGSNYYCTGGARKTASPGYYTTGGTATTRTGQTGMRCGCSVATALLCVVSVLQQKISCARKERIFLYSST